MSWGPVGATRGRDLSSDAGESKITVHNSFSNSNSEKFRSFFLSTFGKGKHLVKANPTRFGKVGGQKRTFPINQSLTKV